MLERHRTVELTKDKAVALYEQFAREYERHVVPQVLPISGDIKNWNTQTIAEALRRAAEIAAGPNDNITVEVIGRYPRELVNYYSRLAGDEEV